MNKIIEKIFKDKHGNIVLAQWPNLPIIVWLITTLLRHFYKSGHFSNILGFTAFVSITFWALLELFTGVNYFRRSLGLIVLLVSFVSRF